MLGAPHHDPTQCPNTPSSCCLVPAPANSFTQRCTVQSSTLALSGKMPSNMPAAHCKSVLLPNAPISHSPSIIPYGDNSSCVWHVSTQLPLVRQPHTAHTKRYHCLIASVLHSCPKGTHHCYPCALASAGCPCASSTRDSSFAQSTCTLRPTRFTCDVIPSSSCLVRTVSSTVTGRPLRR